MSFADDVFQAKYAFYPGETWEQCARRVAAAIVRPVFPDYEEPIYELIRDKVFIPGGRYLYASGRNRLAINNCFLLKAEDSRQGWAELTSNAVQCLSLGGGIGVDYSAIRPNGALISGLNNRATGPLPLMHVINEVGRGVMSGGSRRSAIWAGLSWKHGDIIDFIHRKDWPDYLVEQKARDVNTAAPLDMTNISVILDDDFFTAYDNNDPKARDIYNRVIEQMLKTGEPGFSIDVGPNAGETTRNACTELTSGDDSDVCNLGSIVLPRIKNVQEMRWATKLATIFLLAGTVVGELPYEKVYDVREKNRRLGLGLMGFAEWYARRGIPYGDIDPTLERLLRTYQETSDAVSAYYADRRLISRPVKTRAIAPNGTISIIAETTSGIEPFFSAAYRRRWLDGSNRWREEVIIDAAVQRLLDDGVPHEWIEDAYDLANDPERRIRFQAWAQSFVDHGISSTINLPAPEQQYLTPDAFGEILYKYLPKLRGITTYPDGARGNQPLTRISLEEALQSQTSVEEVGNNQACVNGACGV